MKQQYIDLKMPSIMGMGAVGPTLAVLTASIYSALCVIMSEPPQWAYPVVMLFLSGLLAVFPTSRSEYKIPLKIALWPIVTVIIFSAAWGTNHGLSLGEDAVSNNVSDLTMPSLVPSAYADETNVPVVVTATSTNQLKKTHPAFKEGVKVNEVDFSKIDHSTKVRVPDSFKLLVPKEVWGFATEEGLIYLKDGKGNWHGYRQKVEDDAPREAPQQAQQQLKGGFFKRWRK